MKAFLCTLLLAAALLGDVVLVLARPQRGDFRDCAQTFRGCQFPPGGQVAAATNNNNNNNDFNNFNNFFGENTQPGGFDTQNSFFPSSNGQTGGMIVAPATAPPTTAAPATVATTRSPAYYACMQRCPVTSEYNPICATDNENYHNNSRLQCAIRCGQNIAAVRMGTCAPL